MRYLAACAVYFLGLGAQKAGTTTLHSWLACHPSIFLPACKETHYFSLHYSRGWCWYEEQFHAGLDRGAMCGEITPYYLFHPEAPNRIAATLPDARLIVLLRDPVERAISQYFHACRLGFETLPLREAVDCESERLLGADAVLAYAGGQHRAHQEQSYLSRSHYPEQLEHYQARFSAKQLLVLRSEDLFVQPELCWQHLLAFLSLPYVPCPQLPKANRGRGEKLCVAEGDRAYLRQCLQPVYEQMERDYGFCWE